MNALENAIAIVLTILFLIVVPTCMSVRNCGDNLELCAAESVDEMLADISSDGIITEERYCILSSILYTCGYQDGIRITEYYYEDGIDGKSYQYSISFDEILKEIEENGSYKAKSGSYICICAQGYYPNNILARAMYSRNTIEKSIQVR